MSKDIILKLEKERIQLVKEYLRTGEQSLLWEINHLEKELSILREKLYSNERVENEHCKHYVL